MSQEGIELPGHVLTKTTAAIWFAATGSREPGFAKRLLVLERPGRPLEPRVRDQLSGKGRSGEKPLASASSSMPYLPVTLRLSRQSAPFARGSIELSTIRGNRSSFAGARSRGVGHTPEGLPVTSGSCFSGHSIWSVSLLRAIVQLTVRSSSCERQPRAHIGPARLWVDLARRWPPLVSPRPGRHKRHRG